MCNILIYFAYPPCPAFGEATVTENQLQNWMQEIKTNMAKRLVIICHLLLIYLFAERKTLQI